MARAYPSQRALKEGTFRRSLDPCRWPPDWPVLDDLSPRMKPFRKAPIGLTVGSTIAVSGIDEDWQFVGTSRLDYDHRAPSPRRDRGTKERSP